MRIRILRCKFIVFGFVFFSLLVQAVLAKSVDSEYAIKVVKGFLKCSPLPMQSPLGTRVDKIDTFVSDNGRALYYVVYLKPSGFIIVSADDLVGPIIGFSSAGSFDPSPKNPLGALVTNDLPNRIDAVRKNPKSTDGRNKKAQDKWSKFLACADDENIAASAGISTVSDVRVAPLVQSKWDQRTINNIDYGITCYNYYTPGDDPYSTGGYYCGCVATAMAQFMRYHKYPTAYVGMGSYQIWVDGISQYVSLFGGPYQWSDMPFVPDSSITLAQRQAIGEICRDAGVSVNMEYYADGSGASLYDTDIQLVSRFDYNNCIFGYNNNYDIGSYLSTMINTNLDAQMPVILGISGSAGGHAILCDGYGYNSSTMYHHLNMGWSGNDDVWYDLPYIDTTHYTFTVVDICLYNIYKSGTGEIVSGRITGPDGGGVADVTVFATGGYTAVTNQNGIYALTNLPSNTSYTLRPVKRGWNFPTMSVSTGRSSDGSEDTGNKWGNDLAGKPETGVLKFNKDIYDVPETVNITLMDSDIAGSGTQEILLKICDGDCETIILTEDTAHKGVFIGSVTTSNSAVVYENGTLEVPGSSILVALYEDQSDAADEEATIGESAQLQVVSILINETFSSGIPASWSIVNGGGASTWKAANSVQWEGRDYWDTSLLPGDFVVVDSDSAPSEYMDEQLITPVLDCSSFNSVTLGFDHQFICYPYGSVEIADVDIQLNNGTWQNLLRYTEPSDAAGNINIDLSSYAAGISSVRLRWHYYNANWDYYWGIDNVLLKGIGDTAEPLPDGDFQPDCNVDIEDFAVLANTWLATFDPNDPNSFNPVCDIAEPNEIIDENDLVIFTDCWLW